MTNKVDVTIFHKLPDGTYTKEHYIDCFWDDDMSARISQSGVTDVDSLYVSIPWQDDFKITHGEDLIIKGIVDDDVDNTSKEAISKSIKCLRSTYDVFTINAVSAKNHSYSKRMWHYELSGK